MADPYQAFRPGQSAYDALASAQSDRHTSPTPKPPSANPGSHRRTYQACIPCRRRKVRCDLGEVDNPHDPPCGRCRRESKECFFSATRRKKKTAHEGEADDDGEEHFETRNARKRQRLSTVDRETGGDFDEVEDEDDIPRTPGGSIGRNRPLRRPQPIVYKEEDVKTSEEKTALLQTTEVHGAHDALKLLSMAADMNDERSHLKHSPAALDGPTLAHSVNGSYTNGPMQMFRGDDMWKTKVDAGGSSDTMVSGQPYSAEEFAIAVKAWSRFRFVRAGWLTAREGIEYILYFYKHLSPLTPIVLPDFSKLAAHKKLLEDEPMLTVTILLIASRHMELPGPGSRSRPAALHDKFYKYLDGMIKRIVWGQEQFGGGLCGAGNANSGALPGCDVNPLMRKGLRTLGSVESLLLLTEWHPRAMHFPPDEADDELMVPEERLATPQPSDADDIMKGNRGYRMDAWLEPCWRSDRMCWMLTGMAMSLAFEIGVFDQNWRRHARSTDGQPLSESELAAYDHRRSNVRDVLLIFTTLTSGRVGLTSMLPSEYSMPEHSQLYSPGALNTKSTVHQVTLHYWLHIAAIVKDGNQKFYSNKDQTRQLICSGEYLRTLENMRKPLAEWRVQFDSTKTIPPFMQSILKIEYEHARLYFNAVALQAVVERCVNELAAGRAGLANGDDKPSNVAIRPSILAKSLGRDRQYVYDVGDAARNLLRIVVDELAPSNFLRHAPARTYFRIISTSIVLLKSFALGAAESDVADSLELLERTVDALRKCVVDDVHVACHFAGLLDNLTKDLKPRLVRLAADGRAGRSRHQSRQPTRAHTPNPQDPGNQRMAFGPHQQATSGAMPNAPHWFGNGDFYQQPPNNGYDPSRAMYGITDEPYDLTGHDGQFSVMPPPGFNSTSPASATLTDTNMSDGFNGGNGTTNRNPYGYPDPNNHEQDFLAINLDNLLSLPGGDVDSSMVGPSVNGQDILEFFLQSPTQQQQQTNGYQQPQQSQASGYQAQQQMNGQAPRMNGYQQPPANGNGAYFGAGPGGYRHAG